MSEKRKKVIHVDEVIIKAENVVIEPQRPHRRDRHEGGNFDPFFGPRRAQVEDVTEEEHVEVEEEVEEVHEEEEGEDRRPPFSWI
ncbi:MULTISPECIES: hypothetical protein [Pontibacillus]|uniref:Uncharacterized protein n=1 Tax=Pontibacillus chungwhensis TaxID=265426 RepID=A0ABY8V216_9BACI|nr:MULTISPECIES: hypothetical protein [Pontibacillus]MCD5324659.1 hypothetical protein [Pontibacillus sp. HN14]WIF99046.1 hypothetical protein QNI29_05160 [Pontibacillus chungwhensis]